MKPRKMAVSMVKGDDPMIVVYLRLELPVLVERRPPSFEAMVALAWL